MQVYFDGSYAMKSVGGKRFPDNVRYLSWGLVFTDASGVTEVSGHRTLKSGFGSGYHELVAFVEAALWLHSHGVPPEEVSFVTDDEMTVNGRHATLENGYYFRGQGDRLRHQMRELVRNNFYTEDAVNACWKYLEVSRFDKVKGHSRLVYNERCDYLAKSAFQQMVYEGFVFKQYDQWLAEGFLVRDSTKSYNVKAHFC